MVLHHFRVTNISWSNYLSQDRTMVKSRDLGLTERLSFWFHFLLLISYYFTTYQLCGFYYYQHYCFTYKEALVQGDAVTCPGSHDQLLIKLALEAPIQISLPLLLRQRGQEQNKPHVTWFLHGPAHRVKNCIRNLKLESCNLQPLLTKGLKLHFY